MGIIVLFGLFMGFVSLIIAFNFLDGILEYIERTGKKPGE